MQPNHTIKNNTLAQLLSLKDVGTKLIITSMSESTIIIERSERVGIIKLNRPKAYRKLINELLDALRSFDRDSSIGAIILTGNDKGFCS
jgi:1,4-dihydroxy-2-naphthoyl-CoA synthase